MFYWNYSVEVVIAQVFFTSLNEWSLKRVYFEM